MADCERAQNILKIANKQQSRKMQARVARLSFYFMNLVVVMMIGLNRMEVILKQAHTGLFENIYEIRKMGNLEVDSTIKFLFVLLF